MAEFVYFCPKVTHVSALGGLVKDEESQYVGALLTAILVSWLW